MTIIYIENLQGSGKTVKVIEDFGDYAVHRDLAPGEHACIGVSRLKTLQVQEVALGADGVQPERRTLKSIREVMAQTPALANSNVPTSPVPSSPVPSSLERRAG